MKNSRTAISKVALALAVVLLMAPTANAEELNGHVSGSQKEISSITLANGQIVRRVMFHGGIITDTQAPPFHGSTQQCLGTYIFAADGTPVEGRAGCDGIDPDGDVWWITFSVVGDGPLHWEVVGGTGKYEELEASGTTEFISEWGDGITIGRIEGTYSGL